MSRSYDRSSDDIQKRMREMMEPINSAVQLTDDRNELLMLACAMLQKTTEIFDVIIGESGRKKILRDLT
jgi:DNA-binding transcriptional regulator GbsR (MarR family)